MDKLSPKNGTKHKAQSTNQKVLSRSEIDDELIDIVHGTHQGSIN